MVGRGKRVQERLRRTLDEFEKLFDRIPGLLDDRHERPALEVAAVVRESNPQSRLIRMLQVVMRSFGVVDIKARSFESSQNYCGL
jgi:hypothetical protein